MTQDVAGHRSLSAQEIDIEAWRAAIRRDTFSNYHREMGLAILKLENNRPAAVAHFTQAIELDPHDHLSRYELYRSLLEMGQTGEAAQVRRAGLDLDAGFEVRALCRQTIRHLESDDDLGMVEHCLQQAEAIGQHHALTAAVRTAVRLKQRDYETVRRFLAGAATEAADADRQSLADYVATLTSETIRTMDHGGTVLACAFANHLDPLMADDPHLAARSAKALWHLARYREAIVAFRTAVEDRMVDGATLRLMGNCALRLGHWNEATAALERARQALQGNQRFMVAAEYGQALLVADRFTEAETQLRTLLETAENTILPLALVLAHLYLGLTLMAQDRDDAVPSLIEALDAHAERLGLYQQRSHEHLFVRCLPIAFDVHRQNFTEAAATLAALPPELPEGEIVALLKGQILRACGHLDEAEASYLRMADRPNASIFHAIGLIATRIDAGRPAEALPVSDQLVEDYPEHGWAWIERGQLLEALGRQEDAAKAYATGLAHAPTLGWADLALGGLSRGRSLLAKARSHIDATTSG